MDIGDSPFLQVGSWIPCMPWLRWPPKWRHEHPTVLAIPSSRSIACFCYWYFTINLRKLTNPVWFYNRLCWNFDLILPFMRISFCLTPVYVRITTIIEGILQEFSLSGQSCNWDIQFWSEFTQIPHGHRFLVIYDNSRSIHIDTCQTQYTTRSGFSWCTPWVNWECAHNLPPG